MGVREVSRARADYSGDIEYDPRTGRIFHGNYGISSPRISLREVRGDAVKAVTDTGSYGSASQGGGGGSVVLSQDGSRLYYGALQVGTDDVGKNLHRFPGVIVAASRDVAFGAQTYYRATTGSTLGEFPFRTAAATDPRFGPRGPGGAAVTVSPDGLSVWVIDRDADVARQFALEGDR